MDPDNDHGFAHAEIAYGAFCIFEEEQRKGVNSGPEAHWFRAIERLKRIRAKPNTATRVCYRCDSPPTSVEHVPPKCLFPEKKDLPDGVDYRKNLITVPACDLHNSAKSTDDAYLLAVVAAYYENNKPSVDHYGAKILRALKKSTGFQHCVLAGSEEVVHEGDKTKALRVDTPRFLRSLTSVAHGLYFATYGTHCPHPVQVHTPALFGPDKKPRAEVVKFTDQLRPYLGSAAPQGENPAIFNYQANTVVDETGASMTVIRMVFYEGVEVFALSAPGLEEA